MITKIEPEWYHRYANSPKVKIHTDQNLHALEWIYKAVPDQSARKNTMLLSTNNWPWCKFVSITNPEYDPIRGGALGGEFKMSDGTVFVSRSGWSSRAGVLNNRYADFLPGEILEPSIRMPPYDMLWAGFAISAEYVRDHPKFPKDLYLVRFIQFEVEPYWTISIDPKEVKKPDERS